MGPKTLLLGYLDLIRTGLCGILHCNYMKEPPNNSTDHEVVSWRRYYGDPSLPALFTSGRVFALGAPAGPARGVKVRALAFPVLRQANISGALSCCFNEV